MTDREGPSCTEGKIPEAWTGQVVMLETTEALSTDLRAAAPVYPEDVNERGIVIDQRSTNQVGSSFRLPHLLGDAAHHALAFRVGREGRHPVLEVDHAGGLELPPDARPLPARLRGQLVDQEQPGAGTISISV